MGREATITPEQVNAVADTLKAEGSRPTLRAVRERLGSGSMGTISKFLQNWKARQEREQTSALALPPALQRAILDYMDQELAAARAALESDLAEQQQEAADVGAENERQAEVIEELTTELEALATTKAAAEGKAGQLAADLAAAKEDATRERQAAEAARTELAKAALRLEAMPRLEADLTAARNELEQERQRRIEAEQQAAVLAAQKTALDGRLADAKHEAERTATQLQKAQDRAEQLAEALADARVTVQTQKVELEKMAKATPRKTTKSKPKVAAADSTDASAAG
ncbi:MAG: DNA-binding protein [Acidihalobacter sp.]|uniref:DNA-binding protein n=1 Tax=Acidihalobacter sp. TaxID=1872108 RepID=UPI00307E2B4C